MDASNASGRLVTAVSIEQFLTCLGESGLLSAAEITAVAGNVPPQGDARQVAAEFVRRQKLTRYQASMLCQGRSRGLVLENYIILDKIGAGGMGMVFKARHRQLPRAVAIKVLPPAVTKDPAAVKRFEREVQAAAKLDHPNIVTALDAGEQQGIHFLVMEYVDGIDLARRVKKDGPLPVAEAVDCILQAARGLEYAHKAGVIHRDIKPGNLLLAKPSAAQQLIKILDMGLARFDGDNAPTPDTATAELTKSGSILGTADYMAPEQALNTKKADHRADIYSLGCTLYYLLAGQPPYGGETSMEKLLAHREQPISPLPGAPSALEAVYRRMVAKRADDRYQSMTEVIAALEKCLAGRLSGAGMPTSVKTRRRLVWLAAGVVGLTVAVGVAAWSFRKKETTPLALPGTGSRADTGPISAPYAVYEGIWVVKYKNDLVRTYLVDAAGGVVALFENEAHRGSLTHTDDHAVLDLHDGDIEQMKLVAGQLQVDHFIRKKSMTTPAFTGVGVKTVKIRPASPAGNYSGYQGIWVVNYGNKTLPRLYVIDSQGVVLGIEDDELIFQKCLTKNGEQILLDSGDKKIERIRLADAQLQVERFWAADFPSKRICTGVGTKLQ